MAARLGNVLYWLGCIIAWAIVVLGGVLCSTRPACVLFIGSFVFAFTVWLVGRACRYALAGT